MKSLVADFVIMAACGVSPEELNTEVFEHAVQFMKLMEEEDPIINFEDVYPTLVDNELGAEYVFNCPVTEETKEAYAAYLCYSI